MYGGVGGAEPRGSPLSRLSGPYWPLMRLSEKLIAALLNFSREIS
jgi:hypothetical protein